MKTTKDAITTWDDIPKPEFFSIGFDYLKEQVCFAVILKGQRFEYSGGIRAFLEKDALTKLSRSFGYTNSRLGDLLGHILSGRVKIHKNADDRDVRRLCADIVNLSKPDPKGFFYAILNDMDAGDCNFSEFCANFGYDDDSISALRTHEACRESLRKVEKALTRAQIEFLRKELENY
jgi:hypothetical protein